MLKYVLIDLLFGTKGLRVYMYVSGWFTMMVLTLFPVLFVCAHLHAPASIFLIAWLAVGTWLTVLGFKAGNALARRTVRRIRERLGVGEGQKRVR